MNAGYPLEHTEENASVSANIPPLNVITNIHWSRNVPLSTLLEQVYFYYVTVFTDILCTLILKLDEDIVTISPKGKIIKLVI